MQTDEHEPLSKLDGSPGIHLQQLDGGTSGRCFAFDPSGIVIGPTEVIVPSLTARIEQRDGAIGFRVGRVREFPFARVTSQASECQIGNVARTLIGARHNMVHGQVHDFRLLRQTAVFTATPGAFRYLRV